MSVKETRAERAEGTRRALCHHARALFARDGYAETSTDEIVRRAGLTKGALYHHFENKRDLYRAVVEEMSRELVGELEAAATSHADPWEGLQAMCRAYLDACLDSDRTRILVLEAPVVLDWRVWCDMGNAHEIAVFTDRLRDVVEAGLVRESPEMTAQVLLGALNTAARVIATAPDAEEARRQVEETVDRLLAGLRAPARLT